MYRVARTLNSVLQTRFFETWVPTSTQRLWLHHVRLRTTDALQNVTHDKRWASSLVVTVVRCSWIKRHRCFPRAAWSSRQRLMFF
jgi:hypothetical protein